jgi:hypothetical protein
MIEFNEVNLEPCIVDSCAFYKNELQSHCIGISHYPDAAMEEQMDGLIKA